ncbi:hypothetical protein EON65_03635 [archaeon]|nr:MAG: hypothetical protein EON65_03635 [archaeon]
MYRQLIATHHTHTTYTMNMLSDSSSSPSIPSPQHQLRIPQWFPCDIRMQAHEHPVVLRHALALIVCPAQVGGMKREWKRE